MEIRNFKQSKNNAEVIESGIWCSGIFKKFTQDFHYGGSTNLFRRELGLDIDKPILKLLGASAESSTRGLYKNFFVELLKRIGSSADWQDIVKARLNHSDKIVCVDDDFMRLSPPQKYEALAATDGLITNRRGIPLCIGAADCAPVAIYDPKNKCAGLFHSGWRGTAGLIAVKGIGLMAEKYGSVPKDLMVSIGPAIDPGNFEVDGAVYSEFAKKYSGEELKSVFVPSADGKHFLNIPLAIRMKLVESGINKENIEMSAYSTFLSKNSGDAFYIFPSARRVERDLVESGAKTKAEVRGTGIKYTDSSIFIVSLS